jgi:hypothetical protein
MEYPIKIVKEEDQLYIFDGIRRKYILLTPEEQVRQEFIQWCIEELSFPKIMFQVEKKLFIQGKTSRFDIVIYHQDNPWMLVECKAREKSLNLDTLLQTTFYQSRLNAPFICMTNGEQILCLDTKLNKWLDEFPSYPL